MPVSPAASLIAPDQRLLGWGLTDLTLYGAQPLPGMVVSPANKDAAVTGAPAGGSGDPVGPAAADPQALAQEAGFDQGSAPAETPSAVPAAPVAFQAAPFATTDAAPSVPAPVGSGTAVQPAVATPLHAAADDGHAGLSDAAGAPAVIAADPAHAADPIPTVIAGAAPLAETLTATTPDAAGAIDAVGQTLTNATDGVGTTVAGLVDPLVAAPGSVVEAVDAAAEALPPTVIGAAGTIAEPLVSSAVTTATPAVDAVAATVETTAPVVASIVAPVIETAAQAPPAAVVSVTDLSDHGVGPVAGTGAGLVDALASSPAPAHAADAVPLPVPVQEADLHGLGGSDPAAGVQTLVSMVGSADAFDFGHAAAPSAAASAPSLVDTLAADEAPSALLGDHHDAGADHAPDDHGLHLGG